MSEEPKVFSVSEVEKIVAERVARVSKKLDRFADYDDLKARASEYEQLLEKTRVAEEQTTIEQLLKEAGEKARQTGRLEDVAKYSVLKQKLFGGK